MIQINEYRLTQDKKYLIIDVLILELSYYENVTLYEIILNNQKAFNPTTGIKTEATKSEEWVYSITECQGKKHYRKFVDLESIGFPYSSTDNTMFFILVVCTEELSEDTPCGMKANAILGVTYNKYPLYKKGMSLLSTMLNCSPNNELKDFILLLKAFDISLQLGDYEKAINYWEEFFVNTKTSVKKNCGCHGIYG